MSNAQSKIQAPSISKNQKRKQKLALKMQANPDSNIQAFTSALKKYGDAIGLKSADQAVQLMKSNPEFQEEIKSMDSRYPMKAKLRKLEAALGKKFIVNETHKIGENFGAMNTRQKCNYLEAVIADDLWSAIGIAASEAAPFLGQLAAEYGPTVLNWLFEKASQGYRRIFSKGSGPGMLVYPNEPDEHFHARLSPKIYLVDSNKVHLPYLAALFCPEKFESALPDQFTAQVASTVKTSTLQINTGTDGNAIGYVLPDALMQGASPSLTAWQIAQNIGFAGTTNLITGTPSAYLYSAGAFATGGVNNYARFRATAGSTRIVFNLAAVNNSGSCTLAYTSEPTIGSTFGVSAPAIPNNLALQFPFLHIAAINGTTEMRQIHLPHDVTELALEDYGTTMIEQQDNGGYDLLYFNIEGGPAATTVARVYFTTAMDYQPGTNLLGAVRVQNTPDAPGSIPCAASIIKRMPHVTQLTLDEAMEFSEMILGLQSDQYGYVVEAAMKHLSKIKSRPRIQIGGSEAPDGMSESSFIF